MMVAMPIIILYPPLSLSLSLSLYIYHSLDESISIKHEKAITYRRLQKIVLTCIG